MCTLESVLPAAGTSLDVLPQLLEARGSASHRDTASLRCERRNSELVCAPEVPCDVVILQSLMCVFSPHTAHVLADSRVATHESAGRAWQDTIRNERGEQGCLRALHRSPKGLRASLVLCVFLCDGSRSYPRVSAPSSAGAAEALRGSAGPVRSRGRRHRDPLSIPGARRLPRHDGVASRGRPWLLELRLLM